MTDQDKRRAPSTEVVSSDDEFTKVDEEPKNPQRVSVSNCGIEAGSWHCSKGLRQREAEVCHSRGGFFGIALSG